MTKSNHQTNLSAVHLRKHMRMQRRSLSHCERQRSAYLATRFLYKLIPLLPKSQYWFYLDGFCELPTATIAQFCQNLTIKRIYPSPRQTNP